MRTDFLKNGFAKEVVLLGLEVNRTEGTHIDLKVFIRLLIAMSQMIVGDSYVPRVDAL